jgi:uncharacterized protein (TIGR02117 family)
MKRLWRILRGVLLGLLGLLLLYGFFAVVLSLWSTNLVGQNIAADKVVYVTTGGVHLDIVFPVTDLSPELQQLTYQPERATHVAFGWGERNFYLETPTWSDLTLANAAGAVLINSEALMHVRSYARVSESWKEVHISKAALAKLLTFVEQSFEEPTPGEWQKISSEGYPKGDYFYAATGRYNAINTCNVWLNNALKAAEVRTSIWSPFKYGILYHLEE